MPKMLTAGDVAGLFNVNPRTVSRWVADGKLPYTLTPGGRRRFRAEHVYAILDTQYGTGGVTHRNPEGS